MGVNALNKPTVYVAAPWVRRDEAIEAGKLFEANGFEVTSRWFTHNGDPSDSTGVSVDAETIRRQAWDDIEDIIRADVFVVINLQKSEGKAVETGIALMEGIPIISVGPRSNIFQALCVEVDSLADAIREALNVV